MSSEAPPSIAVSTSQLGALAFVGSGAIAVVATFFLHEGAHWLAGELLGNDMRMTLNAAYPAGGSYADPAHVLPIAAAGPIVTFVQGIVAFLLVRRRPSALAYHFLLAAVIMRLLALFVNVFNPQDEAIVSMAFGLGKLTVPILVAVILLALANVASRRGRYRWRFNVWSVVLMIVVSSLVILTA